MRAGIWAVAVTLLALFAAAGDASAQAAACAKSDFETVVNEAAAALRDLNRKNTPPFQAKLIQLKEKRNWSHDQFLQEAAPFVRDDAIAGYDQKSEELLARITGGGQASGAGPDCALLTELRGALKVLVETQVAKWTYMTSKLDKELTK